MDRDEQRQILREQKAGYAFLYQFNTEQMRNATFEDRIRGLTAVLGFAEYLNKPDLHADDELLIERWIEIRKRYNAKYGHQAIRGGLGAD